MKELNHQIVLTALLLFATVFTSIAQNARPTITVLNIDTKGLTLDHQQMGTLVFVHLILGKFQ